MDLQLQRDLRLLSEVEKNPLITQRSLSQRLGVALGLTNLYLRRLAEKGYIKVTTIPKNRIMYLLTPRGMAEKSRLTYQYIQYSLTYYQNMRQRLKKELFQLSKNGTKKVVIFGTGELAELTYLSMRETNFELVGFVSDRRISSFLSYPVWPPEELPQWDFDVVLVAEIDNTEGVRACLISLGVKKHQIITLVPKG